ncbi:MAG TPA: hypothetical protein VH277_10425, partial [Gemmatimonadaceae bacterium]|nr:hypothetical protein [Gemmatimonadaceae bacterium]
MPVVRRYLPSFAGALVLGLTGLTGHAAVAQAPRPIAPQNTDIPVTKVILFSSGVGYFEHAGLVHGNSATELRFRTNQINDILKSLMLQDQDGGRVGAVTYPSQDPLSKTLRSFQIDITQNPSMAQLLDQLRGARVTLHANGETLTGTILGVEQREHRGEKGEASSVAVLNLLLGASIRSVELPSVTSLTLDDPQLQEELTKALAALVQARDQDKKPVTINFAGEGDRRVRIGYVVETPIWKTSYRLILPSGAQDKPKLQGWAIVENQTERDWNNVSLSLVSGRPISFMMDLYQPLYATRPTVRPELYANLRPQVYDAGTEADRIRVPMAAAPPAQGQRRIGYGADGKAVAMQLNEVVVTGANGGIAGNGPIDITTSVESVANAANLGELFQYTVGNVTLARQKSAMLPIITDPVQIEKLSIYNAAVLRTNPLSGVWLRNTTGKHLLQGPVTVLEKGGYAGDARIDNVPPGQQRFLSYGIDLDLVVDNTKGTSLSTIAAAKIDHGVLIASRRLVEQVEYAADNKSSKDKTLVIEHPARAGWKLVDTQKPFETTPTTYRFKGVAAANKVTTLRVKEEFVQDDRIGLVGIDVSQLQLYVRNGEVPQRVRDALARALDLRQAATATEAELNAKTAQIADITSEQ